MTSQKIDSESYLKFQLNQKYRKKLSDIRNAATICISPLIVTCLLIILCVVSGKT